MRFKKLSVIPLALAVLVSSVACSNGDAPAYKAVKADKSTAESAFTEAELGATVTVQNGKTSITMDTATTHFTVTDLATGKQYSSYFPKTEEVGVVSDDDKCRMDSEVAVTYYEEQSNAQYMFSTRDSVANGSYSVSTSEDAIRVIYKIGATAESSFLPKVFNGKKFDSLASQLLGKMNELEEGSGVASVRRLRQYYDEYTNKNATDDIKEKYPCVKKQRIYVFNEDYLTTSAVAAEEVREYMAVLGYGMQDYEKDLKALGVENTEKVENAGFVIPVEYKLTDDGFTATVLSDLIAENNDTYRLQTVSLLEYMGASLDNNGSFFVPDGSGAIIDWNAEHVTSFEATFYGNDYSVSNKEKTHLSNDLCLPVYGIIRPDGGLFAIVERGAEIGKLKAKTKDTSYTPNHIFTDFEVRHMDTTDIGKNMRIPVFNLFAADTVKVSPSIRYVFMAADKCRYTDMAAYYRNYLIDNGLLNKSSDNTLLYLDYLGLLTEDATFLGFPYKSRTALSTLSGITKSVSKLESKGIKNVTLRMYGYTDAGLENNVANNFEINSDVGSAEQLEKLESKLNGMGGKLYVDGDFSFTYGTGNGFSKKTDASHYLNRVLVNNSNYNIVTRKYADGVLPHYFVSARRYLGYTDGFIKSLKKETELKQYNVSYASAGKYLGGDYTPKATIDRPTALNYLDQATSYAAKKLDNVAFDGGNAYILPYANDLYNIPLNYSNFDAETEYVPFYQMVVRGYINYTGQPVNLSYDRNQYMLRMLEFGAVPYFTLTTGKNSAFTGTAYDTVYFSTSDSTELDKIIDIYSKVAPYYTAVAGKQITSHTKLAEGVYCTAYENGCKMYVNYNGSDVNCDGVTVKANDFAFVS